MSENSWSRLGGGSGATFDEMLNAFGVVTVMNAKVYSLTETSAGAANDFVATNYNGTKKVPEILTALESQTKLCELKTLKIANVTMDGPTKTVTGGQNTNPLIKYGKTARLEMQDALGNADSIEVFNGGVVEHFATRAGTVTTDYLTAGNSHVIHVTDRFAGPVAIVGDSFFVSQKTGDQVKVKIVFFQFLPDSLFNLTQDAEGDATVFDLNGDLLASEILVGDYEDKVADEDGVVVKDFYAICPATAITAESDSSDKAKSE